MAEVHNFTKISIISDGECDSILKGICDTYYIPTFATPALY